MGYDPTLGYDPSALSAPVPVNYGSPMSPTLLQNIQPGGDTATLNQQLDAAQAASGLSRQQFYAQVAQLRPDLIQSSTQGGLNQFMAKEDVGWTKYLPEIIGGGGLLASYLAPAAFGMGGASAATGAAAGGSAATASGYPTALGSTLGYAPDGSLIGGAGGAAGAAGAAGSAASAAGKGFWGNLTSGYGLPAILGTGLNFLGAALQSNAAQDAAKLQAQAAQNALNFEEQRYGQAQQNFAPFIATGQNANQTLGSYMMPSDPSKAPTAANLAPQFNAPLLTNAANNGSNMVTVKAPNGETHQVAAFMAPYYTAKGGTVVQ